MTNTFINEKSNSKIAKVNFLASRSKSLTDITDYNVSNFMGNFFVKKLFNLYEKHCWVLDYRKNPNESYYAVPEDEKMIDLLTIFVWKIKGF